MGQAFKSDGEKGKARNIYKTLVMKSLAEQPLVKISRCKESARITLKLQEVITGMHAGSG
jgi:hypothetical protein